MLEKDGVDGLQPELDGEVVELHRRADTGGVVVDLRGRLLRAQDRENDVIGAEGRAVVEPHPLAQPGAPDQRRHLRPLRRQAGQDLQVAVALVSRS